MSTSPSNAVRPARAINIRLDRIDQLFDTLDPHARWHRHLSDRIEEFILEEAQALPRKQAIRIFLHVADDELDVARAQEAEQALRSHFARRVQVSTMELRDLFRLGTRSLAIGLIVLAICLRIGPWLGSFFAKESTGTFIETGFSILGWAANWRPVEIFLYDWWPIVQQRRLYRRLATAEVDLQRMTEPRSVPAGN